MIILSSLDLWLCPPLCPYVLQSLLDTGVMGRHNKGLPCGMGDPLTYLPLVLFENNHRTHPRCLSSRLFAHRAAIANMQRGGGGSHAVTMT